MKYQLAWAKELPYASATVPTEPTVQIGLPTV